MTMHGGSVHGLETGISILDDVAVFMCDVYVEQCEDGMYVYACVCMYVCMHVYVCVCFYLWVV
jgi:hypothetical protein